MHLCVYVSAKSCDLRCVQHLCPLSIRCTKDLQLLNPSLSLFLSDPATTHEFTQRHTHTYTYICAHIYYTVNINSQTFAYFLHIQSQKKKCIFALQHTLPVHGSGYSHTHTRTHFLSLQDYDMLLIATIISDSLLENWALLLGREAWSRRTQKTKRERKRTGTRREKGHIERVSE